MLCGSISLSTESRHANQEVMQTFGFFEAQLVLHQAGLEGAVIHKDCVHLCLVSHCARTCLKYMASIFWHQSFQFTIGLFKMRWLLGADGASCVNSTVNQLDDK